MKKSILTSYRFYLLAVVCCLFVNISRAQYVTIPDATFASWLSTNGYAACMNGNQLDTTCSAVLNATSMSCSAVSITDLTGVQYFKSLTTLDCSNDSIYTIPNLQQSITQFNCDYNNLSVLPALPAQLVQLQCSNNYLTSMPVLPANLNYLDCGYNNIHVLPALPSTLGSLYAGNDSLTYLPATLPPNLIQLEVVNNQITTLPTLPSNLIWLQCFRNQLTGLPALPYYLANILCEFNPNIGVLPTLPPTLFQLDCRGDGLSVLPALPNGMIGLSCDYNQLTWLPTLPDSLQGLSTEYCPLDSLPALPAELNNLSVQGGNLTWLPALPAGLTTIDCQNNQLTSIPPLPDSMYYLRCNGNANLTCLPELKRIVTLLFQYTGITCLPNYGNVTSSLPAFDSVPLCNIFNNPGGCQIFWNISGQCFYDANSNCIFDSTDVGTNYVKTQLYNSGTLVQQTYSGGAGFYSFDSVANGNYTVQVDTTNLPFVVSCPDSAYYSIALSGADTLSYNNNFAFECRTQGFDVGVQAVLNDYVLPRPNTNFELYTIAGDMSEIYGAHCAAGISGQVQMIYSGQVTYVGPATGAFTPSAISGDTLTWDVADYGGINDFSAFNSLFKIDSLAIAGTSLCFTVTVTPDSGDYNLSNNTLSYCFPVVASLDPNEKEAYPSGVMDTSNHWITYTIRFQNTGSAPAVNVRITDVLDSHLDPSTFQLLTYSAPNLTQIKGNVVTFNFPNINLPDSLTSDSASRGYVQYKIKLKDNLPIGTEIRNEANIYFDLNPAVATNTTTNFIGDSISAINDISNQQLMLQLFPNPAKDYVMVETDDNAIGGTLQITDVTGREVAKLQITNSKFRVPTSALSGGVYFVKVNDLNGRSGVGKLVVE